jgi:hypothetical protein
MAGVPFENVERLATTDTSAAAHELLAKHHKLTADDKIQLGQTLERELAIARMALLESARTAVQPYLIFAAEGARERLTHFLISLEGAPLPPRNKDLRTKERALLLYLQRISAKNDSLSQFGPSSWGSVEGKTRLLALAPQPGIAHQESFLERWTAHGLAAAMNADPAVRAELSPRLHPNGRIEDHQFFFTDTGETTKLDARTFEILGRCDGSTPAGSLGVELKTLEELAQRKMILWEVEVPALEPHAFDVLAADVKNWRSGAARTRWLEQIEPIASLPAKFIHASDTSARTETMNEARRRLQDIGSERATSNRFLYSAGNPIGEECFRECNFSVGEDLINEVAVEAEPWIDLWRDSYAFIASRVAAGLRSVLDKMPIQNGAAPLPAFLLACETAKLSLTGPGLVALAHIGFQEVKAAFHEMIEPHADQAEYELTADDCHFVRNNFQYPKFDEYTYPSADLQISAESTEAVARGEYQWILAELHPPVALLHHGFYWSCPDKPSLHRALASTVNNRPSFHFGIFVADFTASTCVHLIDPIPDLTNFVAGQRGNPRWRIISPSDTEVYVDPVNGDVCLRKIGTREFLGSFARAWIIPLGFHPFQFGMTPHTPRLRCGKVIVQRRTWTVTADELGAGNFTGVSRDLVLAVERLRARRDLPRYVYIRPTEQALRRSGAEGRDKDTKPVFVDLESYLFLEIFHRWLTKAGELEVAEMLPDPDHLLWREADGRRTFELRTLIVPRS